MKRKALIKRIIDAAMILLLPVLMAEILTGQQAHEWLGTGMVLLFVLHHILNFGRMRNLFKGKYSPLRCAGTALNILLLFDFLALAFSGIMMSGFVFEWLPFSGGRRPLRSEGESGEEKMKIMVDKRVGYGYTNCTNTSNTVNTEREGCRRGAGAQGAAETAREGCCAFGKNSGT